MDSKKIHITFLGFIASLTVKGALDTAYGRTIPGHILSAHDLLNLFMQFPSLQVLVFLIVMVRFYYGVYRFSEEEPPNLELAFRLNNLVFSTLLFVTFYLAGLCVAHAATFYCTIGIIHVVDFAWFIVAQLISWFLKMPMPRALLKVVSIFASIDIVTIAGLLGAHYLLPSHFMGAASALMLATSVADVYLNRHFFLHPEEWKKKALVAG